MHNFFFRYLRVAIIQDNVSDRKLIKKKFRSRSKQQENGAVSIFQLLIIHSVCPQILHKILL